MFNDISECSVEFLLKVICCRLGKHVLYKQYNIPSNCFCISLINLYYQSTLQDDTDHERLMNTFLDKLTLLTRVGKLMIHYTTNCFKKLRIKISAAKNRLRLHH